MTDHLTPSERALREAAEAALDCHQVLESDPRAVLALLDEIERLRGALVLAETALADLGACETPDCQSCPRVLLQVRAALATKEKNDD